MCSKHQGLQIPQLKKTTQATLPGRDQDEHVQMVQTTKGTTFNSLRRGQEKMVFWENVSDNANSTFSMESERGEIKSSRYVYVHQQLSDKILEILMQ